MSNDIAALYIKIDSTGAVTASKDLAALDTAAAKVEGTTKKVETATASANRSFGQMATAVKALAASYGILKMAQYVKDATMLAARYETLGVVMRVVGNNAGYSGAQMEAFARGLEKTGISMVEARQSLTRMVQANLDLAQSSKLARVAQDAAVIGNINSSEAFQRMGYGIQSGQVEILRTIGINVNFENSYQNVAKATGRVTTQLSEAEKSQIRMNAVMDAGKMIAGTYEAAMGTAGKQVLSLQRHLDNLKVAFGLAFTPALAEIIETITEAITDLNGELSGDSKDKITAWGVNFRIALIDIQAEIRRFAMLLDKLGGTMTSAQMLLYGPGRALGVKSSTERFERAADANIEYEARYNASDKELERLMGKRIQLEQSLTAEGKKAAKAAVEVAEAKVLAAQNAAAATEKEVALTEKQLHVRKQFTKEYNKAILTTEEFEIASLETRLQEYRENGIKEIELERWKQAELRNIKLRAENERIALYEELYNATGERRYAELAIAAFSEVAKAKQIADAMILESDQDATYLMIDRIRRYADKFKEVMEEIKEAASDGFSFVADESEKAITAPSASSSIGSSTSVYFVGGISFGGNYQAAQEYVRQLQEIADNTAAAAKEAAEEVERAAIEAAEEAERAAIEAAEKQKEIAYKNIDLNIQILELTGHEEAALTAKRLMELSALNESSQLLQRHIYYLEDLATAQEKATKASKEAAQAAKDLADAQDASVKTWADSLRTVISQGQTINDFINSLGVTGGSSNTYRADLAGARSGNATSYGRITQSAGAYITAATRTAGSSTDLARIIAGVKNELSSLSPVVDLDSNIELLKRIETNTGSTATAAQSLDAVGIKAIFDLSQVITFVANSTGIPDDLRTLITEQTKDYQIWLQASLDSTVSEPIKRVLIDGAGVYIATVNAIAGNIDNESRRLAITAIGTYQTTVNAAMGLADAASQKLALTAAGLYLTTVNASLGIVDDASRRLALTATGQYATTVNAIMGIADTDSRRLALTAAGTFLTTVNAVVGTVDATARYLGLTATNVLNTTINGILGVVDADARRLAFTATNTIAATITASLGIVNADARKLAFNTINTIITTITAGLGTVSADARTLALTQAGSYAATVIASAGAIDEASKTLALDAKGNYLATVKAAIGITDEESRKLALTAAGDYLTTVMASLGIVDPAARTLALTNANTYLTKVNAALGTVDATALKLALESANTYITTVKGTLGTVDSTALLLATKTVNTINATITAGLGTVNATARTFALNTSNTLAATVTAALGLTDPGAVALAMKTANSLAATVTAALGSTDANAIALATKQVNDFKTIVSAALATDASTAQLQALLTGTGTSTTTVNGNLLWNPDDPLKSVFDAIRTATQQTAANTGQYTVLTTGVGYGSASTWTIYNPGGTVAGATSFLNPYGTSDPLWSVINEQYRPKRFAEGGIATGPTSGYEATLHGTELVVSPLASYPATVKGGDNSELLAEIKKLNAKIDRLEAGNYQIAKHTQKTAKTLEKFDYDGLPETRVA
jgi:hypothetical protein